MLRHQLLSYEAAKALQILAVQFNVIVSCSLHPEGLHGFGAALEQSQAVGEVNHLILGPVDDEHWRCDFGHFLNAKKREKKDLRNTNDLFIIILNSLFIDIKHLLCGSCHKK